MQKKTVQIVSFTTLDGGTEELVVNLAPAHETVTEESVASISEEPIDQVKAGIIDEFGYVSAVTNDSSTQEKFQGRTNYKKVVNELQSNTIDIWYEMPLYGKINNNGAIAALSENTFGKNVAPLFLVKALTDFINSFNSLRYLSKESKFLKNLKVKRHWEDLKQPHNEQLDLLYAEFFQKYLVNMLHSEEIKNIDDFYDLLLEHITETKSTLTWPGFMEGNNSHPFATGLVYDFHTGDPQSDTEKLEFMEDPNYEAFLYLAKKRGFKADPNVPWRLIADLRSDNMWPYLAKYHLKGSNDKPFASADLKSVFNEVFVPAENYRNFLLQFVGVVIGMYNQFLEDYPTYRTLHLAQLKATRKTKVQVLPRKLYEEETLSLKWIVWYAEIRNAERGSPLSDKKLKMLIKNVKQITRHAAIKLEAGNNEEYRKFSELAITHIEYSLGTIASVNKPLDRKDLTTHEKDVILLMNFS